MANAPKYSRGEFLGFGAALAGAYGLGQLPSLAAEPAAVSSGTEPDFIVVNGRVYTSDLAQPRAEQLSDHTPELLLDSLDSTRRER